MAFADALRALNDIKKDGVIEDYAIAGAMAVVFWTEPAPTFDLDVFVRLPGPATGLVEHIIIEGLPTQLIPAPNPLTVEAIAAAAELDYEGVRIRVARPEYLIALYLQPEARTQKRRERAAMLLALPTLNRALVDEILERYGLSP